MEEERNISTLENAVVTRLTIKDISQREWQDKMIIIVTLEEKLIENKNVLANVLKKEGNQ